MGVADPQGTAGGRDVDIDEERVAAHGAGEGEAEDGSWGQAPVDEGEGAVVGEGSWLVLGCQRPLWKVWKVWGLGLEEFSLFILLAAIEGGMVVVG